MFIFQKTHGLYQRSYAKHLSNIALASCLIGGGISAADAELTLPANILRIEANMVVDKPQDILALVDQGQAAGATAILMNDSKATRWGVGETNERWLQRMKEVREGVADRGLDFGFNTITLGFASSILAADPNLATGYPVINQPMMVRNGKLLPVSTATVENGSFEFSSDGTRPQGFSFQDAPGLRTRIDANVARSGQASFRADASANQMSRLSTTIAVEPNQQYTLSVWARTRNLSARNLQVIIKDPDSGRTFTNQWPSILSENNQRTYIRRVSDLDLEWTEFRLPFNSQEATKAKVLLAVFGGTQGSVWWDDLSIENTPTMNWIRREGLTQTLFTEDGVALIEGTDVTRIEDPLTGRVGYTGRFDTYHEVPNIDVIPGGRLDEGDRAYLTGWHTQITARGQKGASWNDPAVARLVAKVHRRLHNAFEPDFIHYNDSETRTGGFEPFDQQYPSTGAAFAAQARRHINRIIANSGDATVLVWGDMFDPNHNARSNYYQIAGDLDRSWRGLNPDKVVVVNWWSKDKLRGEQAPASIAHFANLGFRQILAGYYEEDVVDNRQAWERASEGYESTLVGSMFYTNFDGYQDLDEFGREWWQ